MAHYRLQCGNHSGDLNLTPYLNQRSFTTKGVVMTLLKFNVSLGTRILLVSLFVPLKQHSYQLEIVGTFHRVAQSVNSIQIQS